MKMKCARCEKEFIPEHINFFRWLFQSGLDGSQSTFVLISYGRHLCNDCLKELKECYYAVSVNPMYKRDRIVPEISL